jgi:isopenicillin N synthase-like dioxygenase
MLEALVKKLVPIYAVALDLPSTYFDSAFAEPQYAVRMSHYPFVEALELKTNTALPRMSTPAL